MARHLDRLTQGTPHTIRVLLVIGQQWIADALATVLRADPDLALLEVEDDPLQAAAQAHRMRPDVVLLDCLARGTSTAAITAMLGTGLPRFKIIALTACAEDTAVARYARAGAVACVTGSWSSTELIDAIKRVHAGEVLFSPRTLVCLLTQPSRGGTGEELTPREQAVLQALADGLTVAEIADQMAISPATVQTHLKNVMPKLGARTRLEAVMIGLRTGAIELREPPSRGL